MPFPLIVAAIGALAPVVMGAIGNAAASGDRAKAEQLRQEAMRKYNIKLPEIEEIAAEVQADSSLGNYQQDPRIAKARMDALKRLGQASEEGYSIEDRAAVGAIMDEVGQADRSSREAIQQRFSPNSGAAIAAQMQAQQNSYGKAHRNAMDMAANSRKQALAALSQYGQTADQYGRSDFGEAQGRANAQDSINRFNTQNRTDAGRLKIQQGQQQFNNQLSLANAQSGAMNRQADQHQEQAGTTANQYLEAGRAGGQAVVGAYQATQSPTNDADYQEWLRQKNATRI